MDTRAMTFCEECGQPIVTLTNVRTGMPVRLDWGAVAYGAHVARRLRPQKIVDEWGEERSGWHHYLTTPSPHGARWMSNMADSTCIAVAPSERTPEDGVHSWRQEHRHTCSIWSARVALGGRRRS